MSEVFKVVVIGSGPGGLSAAARAAELDIPHVLLEAAPHYANTIQRYQKGKHVMAEPAVLPLRSPLEFLAGKREQVLEVWGKGLEKYKVNIRFNAEVVGIDGRQGDFQIRIKNGEVVRGEFVVLAIGMQGNPRKVGAPGDDLPLIQYTLDDPDAYKNETIVVLGAGDAAIENAIALAKQNKVYIVNRKDEFARAKQGNLDLIVKAIEDGKIGCFYNSTVARIEPTESNGMPGIITLNTADGEASIPCHRVIARLGAIPPRKFVESCGINFPSADPNAIPVLTSKYESAIPGLYVVGSLAGYPLIKQAMNQGYETVAYIRGEEIKPADHPLLEERFKTLPYELDVDTTLSLFQERIPMFSEINALQFREFIIDSNVITPEKGQIIFDKGDYTNTFYTVVDGDVQMQLEDSPSELVTVTAGQFFGEIGLLSGRRRTEKAIAGKFCVLIETPRRTMIKLISSNNSVKRGIDEIFIARAIQRNFTPNVMIDDLRGISRQAILHQYEPGNSIFKEGEAGERIHLVRKGSVAISREINGKDVVLSYVPSGQYFGEMALMGNTQRRETARATVATETISLDKESFISLVGMNPALKDRVQAQVRDRLVGETMMESNAGGDDIISFLMEQGLGEATNALLIDESLCIGCDNCEHACAETHAGISRLNRKEGASYAFIHVPTACRHCENPHCMKDCPTDAIQRQSTGEVFIDSETCIGCGNCERNCIYRVIKLAYNAPKKPSILQWMFLGAGPGPGESKVKSASSDGSPKKAVKCDLCKDIRGGPACVRSCPTGAAKRLGPEQFTQLVVSRSLNKTRLIQ